MGSDNKCYLCEVGRRVQFKILDHLRLKNILNSRFDLCEVGGREHWELEAHLMTRNDNAACADKSR